MLAAAAVFAFAAKAAEDTSWEADEAEAAGAVLALMRLSASACVTVAVFAFTAEAEEVASWEADEAEATDTELVEDGNFAEGRQASANAVVILASIEASMRV